MWDQAEKKIKFSWWMTLHCTTYEGETLHDGVRSLNSLIFVTWNCHFNWIWAYLRIIPKAKTLSSILKHISDLVILFREWLDTYQSRLVDNRHKGAKDCHCMSAIFFDVKLVLYRKGVIGISMGSDPVLRSRKVYGVSFLTWRTL
mgnify:CR=1 FL=1